MPRPKRKYTTRKQESTFKKDDSMHFTLMDTDSKMIENGNFKFQMWKGQVKDKIKSTLIQLNNLQKQKLEAYELEFNNMLLRFSSAELNTYMDLNSEVCMDSMLQNSPMEDEMLTSPKPTPRIKRRSKSVNTEAKYTKRSHFRSTSVDTYKTPKGRIRLSSIMTHKKYTVTKPAKTEHTGLNVKRIMKPDEVAISTCGSPLYVASCNVGAPHVNIPLPGGVVLNIEPKDTKSVLEVPGLDTKTKNQLKILCEHLKKLF